MMGSRHFAIGCAGAAALVIYGLQTGDVGIAASALPVPMAVWWPDADHPRSKLGRQKEELIDKVFAIAKIVGFGSYMISILSEIGPYIMDGSLTKSILIKSLASTSLVFLPVIVCLLIARSDTFKEKTKFFTKHRGIMHTLIPVLGMVIGGRYLNNQVLTPLINGCAIGYSLHLAADTETYDGCPLLWPIYKKPISLLPVRTNTKMELIVCAIDCGVLLCLPYWIL